MKTYSVFKKIDSPYKPIWTGWVPYRGRWYCCDGVLMYEQKVADPQPNQLKEMKHEKDK